MRLKEAIEQINGMRFVVDRMPIFSPVGRRCLLAQEWIADMSRLQTDYADYEAYATIIADKTKADEVCDVEHLISQTHDIENTIDGLMGGMILGDIEFFELKAFALIAERLRNIISAWKIVDLPSLKQVVEILDPERSGVSAFHIYDMYSEELAQVRAKLKRLNMSASTMTVSGTKDEVSDAGSDEAAELYQYSLVLEDRVRKDLAFQLRPLAASIRLALQLVARLDIIQAHVQLAKTLSLVRPTVSDNVTRFKALVNPQVAEALKNSGKEYQPIDIDFSAKPTLISGINMGGKTVCLKTLALVQTMFHFGFYIPAAEADVVPVSRVMLVLDDYQSELSGLSSFAGEMRQVNDIIKATSSDSNILVLIDELARTTNPVEGRAIVEAMLHLLVERGVRSFVSSHYDHINADCRRLRVKGLRDNDLGDVDVTHIDRYIDYALIPDNETEAPHEALRIARLLGVDQTFLDMAEHRLADA